MGTALRFLEIPSAPDVSFWARLAELKLNEYKLSEDPIPVVGHYRANVHEGLASPLTLTSASFDLDTAYDNQIAVEGEVVLLNTLESMKTFDRKAAALSSVTKVRDDVLSGACYDSPSKLNRFVVLCYADLKQYTFYYWVCVPAVKTSDPIVFEGETAAAGAVAGASAELCKACDDFHQQTRGRVPLWLVEETGGGEYVCRELENWKDLGERMDKVSVAHVDISHTEDNPGWPLRNFLFFLAGCAWGAESLVIIGLKEEKSGRFSPQRTTRFRVRLPSSETFPKISQVGAGAPTQVMGWEHNARGGLGPRSVNLASTLDPKQRAAAAMDLNLKLMRWRALPDLQVDQVANAKCLLLGAGTLGCAVARILQGWGCRSMTFVDSGKVAFSNPVRQSLFEFADCLDGGKPKATAAAAAMKKIFPDADTRGVQLTIPMPGYPVKEGSAQEREAMAAVADLDALVRDHDIVFLLTDTRESRWLPTVLSLARGKLAVSVALGFDTFLVMRHGSSLQTKYGVPRLGCYFCNDVAAPLNSTKNRTLDQQCTVVRPGLASMASALAVELVSSILQHPHKAGASDKEESILGGIPHSIRGFLDSFSQLTISCPAFPNCVACSDTVTGAYMDEAKREAFLLKVFNDPMYLEDITGLTKLKEQALASLEGMEIESDDEECGGDGGGDDSEDDFQLL